MKFNPDRSYLLKFFSTEPMDNEHPWGEGLVTDFPTEAIFTIFQQMEEGFVIIKELASRTPCYSEYCYY